MLEWETRRQTRREGGAGPAEEGQELGLRSPRRQAAVVIVLVPHCTPLPLTRDRYSALQTHPCRVQPAAGQAGPRSVTGLLGPAQLRWKHRAVLGPLRPTAVPAPGASSCGRIAVGLRGSCLARGAHSHQHRRSSPAAARSHPQPRAPFFPLLCSATPGGKGGGSRRLSGHFRTPELLEFSRSPAPVVVHPSEGPCLSLFYL